MSKNGNQTAGTALASIACSVPLMETDHCSRGRRAHLIVGLAEHSGANQTVLFVHSRARNQKCRLIQPRTTFSSVRNPNALLRFHDGASWHCRHGGNVLSPQQLPRVTFASWAQEFGGEPNALPKFCNSLMQKNFGSPGKIRTCNPSVNSRTG